MVRALERVGQLARLRPSDIVARLTFAPVSECLRVRRAMTRRGIGGGEVFFVRPKDIGGRLVPIRPGTADAHVMWDTFVGRYHLPPQELGPLRCILDLGSNIGLTVAHFAVLFPDARIVGVELDPETADVARRVLQPWDDRCSIVVAAAWFEDGEVTWGTALGEEHAAHVGPGHSVARAVSLNTLCSTLGVVDYVKMDIEGAEAYVLKRNTEWARKVRAINVECHGAYTVDECSRDLRSLGFLPSRSKAHWAAVTAIKNGVGGT